MVSDTPAVILKTDLGKLAAAVYAQRDEGKEPRVRALLKEADDFLSNADASSGEGVATDSSTKAIPFEHYQVYSTCGQELVHIESTTQKVQEFSYYSQEAV